MMTMTPTRSNRRGPATRLGLCTTLATLMLLGTGLFLQTGCKQGDAEDPAAGQEMADEEFVDPTELAAKKKAEAAAKAEKEVVVGEDGIPRPAAKPKPKSPKPGELDLTEEQQIKIRLIALKRFEEEMAKQPPFDRLPVIKRILKESYQIDYDADFPYGFDANSVQTRKEIDDRLSAKLESEADEKFPPAQKEHLEKEALTLFPLYKVGDVVKVVVAGGRFYEGTVAEITKEFVKIGLHRVDLADIVEPDPRVFNPETTQRLRDSHVRVNYTVHRTEFLHDQAVARVPKLMKENGFYRVDNRWMRIDEIIAKLVNPQVDLEEGKAREVLEARVKEDVHQKLTEEGVLSGENLPETVEGLEEAVADLRKADDDGSRPHFGITGPKLKVNGEEIAFPMPLPALVKLLGPPERSVSLLVNEATVWDSLGVVAFSNSSTKQVFDLTVFFTPPSTPMKQLPTAVTEGRYVIDGVVLDRQTSPGMINKQITDYTFVQVDKKPVWKSKRDAMVVVITQIAGVTESIRLSTREP